jgi:hypothetical protein
MTPRIIYVILVAGIAGCAISSEPARVAGSAARTTTACSEGWVRVSDGRHIWTSSNRKSQPTTDPAESERFKAALVGADAYLSNHHLDWGRCFLAVPQDGGYIMFYDKSFDVPDKDGGVGVTHQVDVDSQGRVSSTGTPRM